MRQKTLILWGFVILKFLLQLLLVNSAYELHRDEFLHLDQANHLAWGFMSVPPFTSWTSFIIQLLGNSVFWIKFFPALWGALTLVLVWKTVDALGGRLYAKILAATAVLLSALLRINILYQPNSFDILAWTMVFYALIQHIKTFNDKWLYIAAIAFAFGFLNKYNILFLFIGLVPALLISYHRRLFTNKHFYYALIFALVLVIPNLIWQYLHNFPVISHLNELTQTQLVNVDRIAFLREQLYFFFGSLLIILAAFFALLTYMPFRKYQLIFWTFVFTLAIFISLRAKAYYAIGLYPVFLAFGAVYIETISEKRWTKTIRIVMVSIPVLLFIPTIQLVFPVMSPSYTAQHSSSMKELGLLRWEDGKDHQLPQDYADMQGWKELAQKVDAALESLPRDEYTLILCDNYGQAGAINYYSKYKDLGAVSMNADYINWFNFDTEIKHVILVKDAFDDDKIRSKEHDLFDTIQVAGQIENNLAREFGTSIYVLKNAKTSINQILKDEIASKGK